MSNSLPRPSNYQISKWLEEDNKTELEANSGSLFPYCEFLSIALKIGLDAKSAWSVQAKQLYQRLKNETEAAHESVIQVDIEFLQKHQKWTKYFQKDLGDETLNTFLLTFAYHWVGIQRPLLQPEAASAIQLIGFFASHDPNEKLSAVREDYATRYGRQIVPALYAFFKTIPSSPYWRLEQEEEDSDARDEEEEREERKYEEVAPSAPDSSKPTEPSAKSSAHHAVYEVEKLATQTSLEAIKAQNQKVLWENEETLRKLEACNREKESMTSQLNKAKDLLQEYDQENQQLRTRLSSSSSKPSESITPASPSVFKKLGHGIASMASSATAALRENLRPSKMMDSFSFDEPSPSVAAPLNYACLYLILFSTLDS
jgi:hypothetical protein